MCSCVISLRCSLAIMQAYSRCVLHTKILTVFMTKIIIFCVILSSLVVSGLFQQHPDQSNNETKKNYIVLSVIFGTRSHAKPMLYIGEEMIKRNHEVAYMGTATTIRFAMGFNISTILLKTPANTKPFKSFASDMMVSDALKVNGYSDVEIEELRKKTMELRKKTAEQRSIAVSIWAAANLVVDEAYETAVFGLLDAFEKRRPDLVICDFMGMACMDVCAHLRIPYVITVHTLALIHHPELPKHIPNNLIGRSFFSVTFWERCYDKFILGPHLFALMFPVLQKMNRIRTKYALPTYYNPQYNIAHHHILLTSFFGFDIPQLMSPFIHSIGPIIGRIEREKKIPNDLLVWLEEARILNQSVIYVASGSIAIPSRDQIKVLLDGFSMDSSCNVHVRKSSSTIRVLWSLSGLSMKDFPLETKNSAEEYNVRFEQWVPQLTVFGHASVKLFLTHGGMESIHEVLSVGKPSIIIPFFGDQSANARLSHDRGVADFLNKNTMTPKNVCEKVHKLITDYTNHSSQLYQNLYKMSRMIHHNMNNYKHIYNVLEMEMDIGSQHLIPPSVSWVVAHDADLWISLLTVIGVFISAIWFANKKLCGDRKEKTN